MANAENLRTNNFKIPTPFGNGAAYKTSSGDIPSQSPTGSVKASWQDGFPAQTFQPNNAPSGADFNGMFNLITALLMNTQLGQCINEYDQDFQSNQGGYPMGATIWVNTTSGNYSTKVLVQSTLDSNTNNPVVNGTINTAGGWKVLLPITTSENIWFPNYDLPEVFNPYMPYQFVDSGWLFIGYYNSMNTTSVSPDDALAIVSSTTPPQRYTSIDSYIATPIVFSGACVACPYRAGDWLVNFSQSSRTIGNNWLIRANNTYSLRVPFLNNA